MPPSAILDAVDLPAGYTLVKGALQRELEFRDFKEALNFVNRVGELAEREGHHPDIEIHWNRVTLRWWTHVEDAVTARDYELAEKSNELRLR
nr:4a-hydroxytetrahydrobiopterin dehydratase [Actinomycetota bacterium]